MDPSMASTSLSSFTTKYWCVILQLFLVLFTLAAAAAPPPRKKVAVEGVVYCDFCTRNPNNSFHHQSNLSPLHGAVVKLQCNNTKKGPWEEEAKTDGQGQFVVRPRKVSTWGIHKCKLFMVSSPNADCYTPRFDGPWKLGFPLTAVNTTTSPPADLQYYTTSQPLLYYYYWPDCY